MGIPNIGPTPTDTEVPRFNQSVENGGGTVLSAVRTTQAAYDALGTKVATTLYVIVG